MGATGRGGESSRAVGAALIRVVDVSLRTLPTLTSLDFARLAEHVRGFPWRAEVQVDEIPGPARIASYALALEAEVNPADAEGGSGKLILLHEPQGNDAWAGNYRFVTYARCDVDFDMVIDPLLADVGWSWLTEALDNRHARYHSASGTVTTMSSRSFGGMKGEPDRAEVEIRASWTAEIDQPADLDPHLAAWQELLCATAGIPPETDGVVSLFTHLHGNR